jgi:hypothetical protein
MIEQRKHHIKNNDWATQTRLRCSIISFEVVFVLLNH